MDSIDDIWDIPVAPRSPPRAAKEPLFLQESDDENDRMPDAPPRRTAVDIDAMFSAVENLPDEPEDDANTPSHTPHPILSSSPAHHLDGDGDQGGGEKKPKKKIMRLDEGRLVGDSGFPQLIQDTKNVKIKGKGHEASDLNRLLQVYQFWTHRLYPKTPFKETVDRVEKLCHSKRMHNMLGVWRDEAHGVLKGKKPGDDDDDDEEGGVIDLTDRSVPGPDSDQADYASSSSHAATRPPSSAEEDGDVNGFDFDADMAAMDASARRNAQQTDSDMDEGQPVTGNEPDPDNLDATVSRRVTENEDEEAIWQELHGRVNPPPASHVSHATQEDDEELWDIVDQAMKGDGPDPTPYAARVVARDAPSDEEEEGWNMVDEMTQGGATATAPQPKMVSTVEENYEDMYIDGS
ncbi:replication fork protection component Swi3-domain-containing protein [Mycena vulgaris]|nr:replication fork protection component Swi3-domain-containing protein [Mycena vulgaris]